MANNEPATHITIIIYYSQEHYNVCTSSACTVVSSIVEYLLHIDNLTYHINKVYRYITLTLHQLTQGQVAACRI